MWNLLLILCLFMDIGLVWCKSVLLFFVYEVVVIDCVGCWYVCFVL